MFGFFPASGSVRQGRRSDRDSTMESSSPPKLQARRRSETSSGGDTAGAFGFKNPKAAFAVVLLALDAVLVPLIIAYVPCNLPFFSL